MRISTNPLDDGYENYQKLILEHKIARVFLNDEEVELCHMADDDCGTVIRTVLDEDGRLVVEGDEIVSEKLRGKVKIVIEPR